MTNRIRKIAVFHLSVLRTKTTSIHVDVKCFSAYKSLSLSLHKNFPLTEVCHR